MVEDKWLLLASIPVVVFLGISIWRRMSALNRRIDQLKREEASGPINPYQAMYEIMSEDPDRLTSTKPSPLLLKAMGKSPASSEDHGTKSQADGTRRQEDNDG